MWASTCGNTLTPVSVEVALLVVNPKVPNPRCQPLMSPVCDLDAGTFAYDVADDFDPLRNPSGPWHFGGGATFAAYTEAFGDVDTAGWRSALGAVMRSFALQPRADGTRPGQVALVTCAAANAATSKEAVASQQPPRVRFECPHNGSLVVSGSFSVVGDANDTAPPITPSVTLRRRSGASSALVVMPAAWEDDWTPLGDAPATMPLRRVSVAHFKATVAVVAGDVVELGVDVSRFALGAAGRCVNTTLEARMTYRTKWTATPSATASARRTRSASLYDDRRRTATETLAVPDAATAAPSTTASAPAPTDEQLSTTGTSRPQAASTSVATGTSPSALPPAPTSCAGNGSCVTTAPLTNATDPAVTSTSAQPAFLESSNLPGGFASQPAAQASFTAAAATAALSAALGGPGDALQLARSSSALQILYLCYVSDQGGSWTDAGLRYAISTPLEFPDALVPWLRLQVGGASIALADGQRLSVAPWMGAVIGNVGGTLALTCVIVACGALAGAGRSVARSVKAARAAGEDVGTVAATVRLVGLPGAAFVVLSLSVKGTTLVAARLWSALPLVDSPGTAASVAVVATAIVGVTAAWLWYRFSLVAQSIRGGGVAYVPFVVCRRVKVADRVEGGAGEPLSATETTARPPAGLQATESSWAVSTLLVGDRGWFSTAASDASPGQVRLELDGAVFRRYGAGAESSSDVPRRLYTTGVELAATCAMAACEGVAWRYCQAATVVAGLVTAAVALWFVVVRPASVPVRNVIGGLSGACAFVVVLLTVALWARAPLAALVPVSTATMWVTTSTSLAGGVLSVARAAWVVVRRVKLWPIRTVDADDSAAGPLLSVVESPVDPARQPTATSKLTNPLERRDD